jgi:hypothetical protein
MNRTVAQAAKLLEIDVPLIKKWAVLFHDYLGRKANPLKGQSRIFSDTDLFVLAYVAEYWEAEPDIECIKIGLNQEDHLENQRLQQIIYLHTPILQEPPDELDETWRHGILLNGGGQYQYLELARNYRHAAESLLDEAVRGGEPLDLASPVLFSYRHTLELYLKIIGEIDEPTHSLARCVHLVERRHGSKVNAQIKGWIQEFDKIDPHPGTSFRYADDTTGTIRYSEYWIDFVQFKFAMKQVFNLLDNAILRLGATGKPVVRKQTPAK